MNHAAFERFGIEDLSVYKSRTTQLSWCLKAQHMIQHMKQVLVFCSTARIFTSTKEFIMFPVQNKKIQLGKLT